VIDFLGIGAQKAGTSWLWFNLKHHPEIWTPFLKEVHYFDVKYLDFPAEERLMHIKEKVASILSRKNPNPKRARYLKKVVQEDYCFTEDWYRHIFSRSPSDKTKGEFTPYYSCLPDDGIRYVKKLAPKVKLIFLIRDPVARAISSLGLRLDRGLQEPEHQIVSDPSFQLRGDYRRNINAWESVFDQNRILYIPFGRVKSQPGKVMRDVEDFLGLSQFDEYPNLMKPRHVSSRATVDDRAAEIIAKFSEAQYSFLRDRFGDEFVAEIK